MDVQGEYKLDLKRQVVWDAITDPEVLRACIPGCESLEQSGENSYTGKVAAAVGPVKAKFNCAITLENLFPPAAYSLVGEGKSVAGFGKGQADIALEEHAEGGTLLSYSANFKVGGKLAQVGSRLVLGATRKTADQFFDNFANHVSPGTAEKVEPEAPPMSEQAEPRAVNWAGWAAGFVAAAAAAAAAWYFVVG